MSFTSSFFMGVGNYFKALPFIFRHGMGWVFLIPVGINIVLYSLIFYATGKTGVSLQPWVQDIIAYIGTDITWLNNIISGLVYVLVYAAVFVAFAFCGGFIVIIIMSPVLSYISEKADCIVTGRKFESSWAQIASDVRRGIVLSLRNMILQMLVVMACFIVGLIPVIGWLAAPVLFMFNAYFYGASFLDFSCERYRLNVAQSTRFVKQHKGLAIGVGIGYMLLLLIPWAGIFLSSFIAIVATVSATLCMLDNNIQLDITQRTY